MFRMTFVLTCLLTFVAEGATLARDGRALATVVHADGATAPERTAARELSHYLSQVTGATFGTVAESAATGAGARVYVGPTAFAASKGIDVAALGPEEWVIRTVGDDLVLAGGRPRGALYAAYRFLEDVVGVHWWSPWEESVPRKPTLDVGDLDRRGKPVIGYRDIYILYGRDGGRFAARNRLNRDGDSRISKEYGGCMDYGPPYHVHTFYMYVPPAKYFERQPEWFSMNKAGKRYHERGQLCLTNPALRAFVVKRLKGYIAEARARAKEEGAPAPAVFDISQNDWRGSCLCEQCQALARAEGSEAGPLFDFINYVADQIKDEYPGVYIDTLAYMMTQKAPKTIRVRDNVIVRLCDTSSNVTRPITHEENTPFREHLLSWARIAKNLRIWDYAVTYGPIGNLPMPTVHTYPMDYQFYAEHSVEGVFTEHEFPVLADMRDFKIWMMMKLLEDPYRDYDALVRTFTDGFYRAAAPMIREYRTALEAAAERKPAHIGMSNAPQKYRYLDLAFCRTAHALFDKAEAAAAGDAVLLRRVRQARLSLDRATLLRSRYLMREWVAAGNSAVTMPLDRHAIARRMRDTWTAMAKQRWSGKRLDQSLAKCESEVAAQLARKDYVPLPERFRHLPPGSVFDYAADMTRNWRNIVRVVPDAETEVGITNRLEFPPLVDAAKHPVERYRLPMPWGLYDQARKTGCGSGRIKPADVPGPGYHWYKMGTFKVWPSTYLYFFWSWIIQVDIDDCVDPAAPDQKFDVWARIKFEGPAFPHGKPGEANAICVERVVLVKKGK